MADIQANEFAVTVAPNSLISISDQSTRFEASKNNKPACGALIGEYQLDRDGNLVAVKIMDCIEILERSELIDSPKDMLETMLKLCQANYPERELLGYYVASKRINVAKPKRFQWPMSAQNPCRNDEVTTTRSPTVFLAWNSSTEEANNNPIRTYQILPDGSIGPRIEYTIDNERDAEMIALTDVLTLECNRTSLTKLQRYREGVTALEQKARFLLDYISQPPENLDPAILRGVKSLLSRLPLNGGSEFSEDLLKDFSTSQMYAYLGAMTNATGMMAHNSLATQRSMQKGSQPFMGGMRYHMRMDPRM